MKEWRAFKAKYLPDADVEDSGWVRPYGDRAAPRQCGGDFSRENVMRQVTGMRAVETPVLLPAIRADTSQTDHRPIEQMQLQRRTGTTWERFGPILEGAKV
jgi:branched-chain amino acid transport system substrate-binding protein